MHWLGKTLRQLAPAAVLIVGLDVVPEVEVETVVDVVVRLVGNVVDEVDVLLVVEEVEVELLVARPGHTAATVKQSTMGDPRVPMTGTTFRHSATLATV